MNTTAAAAIARQKSGQGNLSVTAGWLTALAGTIQLVVGLAVIVDPALQDPNGTFFRYAGLVLFVGVGLFTCAGIVAIYRAGLSGRGTVALIGLIVAGGGRLLFAVGEVGLRMSTHAGEGVLSVADPISGLGLIVLGVGVLRARRWQGAGRFAPMACGIFVFAVLAPTFAISHGPNFLAVAAWGMLWVWLGLALVSVKRTD